MVFYIPLPSFANQQGGITKFFVVWERNPRAKYSFFFFFFFFNLPLLTNALLSTNGTIVGTPNPLFHLRNSLESYEFISSLENWVNSSALSSCLFKALYANPPPRLFYAQLYMVYDSSMSPVRSSDFLIWYHYPISSLMHNLFVNKATCYVWMEFRLRFCWN